MIGLGEVGQDHFRRQRNRRALPPPAEMGVGGTPGEGPFSKIWIRAEGGKVVEASYECNGCPSAVAASSLVVALALGRNLQDLESLTAKDLITVMGGIPRGKEFYADLAKEALTNVIEKCLASVEER